MRAPLILSGQRLRHSHVQIASPPDPLLRLFHAQCRHESQTGLHIRKILTTRVRRLISSLGRSKPFVVRMRPICQWEGNTC